MMNVLCYVTQFIAIAFLNASLPSVSGLASLVPSFQLWIGVESDHVLSFHLVDGPGHHEIRSTRRFAHEVILLSKLVVEKLELRRQLSVHVRLTKSVLNAVDNEPGKEG